jgi:uncharacterized protein YxeA
MKKIIAGIVCVILLVLVACEVADKETPLTDIPTQEVE